MVKLVNYSNTSPYSDTTFFNGAMDIWTPREVPFEIDDPIYEIEAVYKWRPDLLSDDLYDTPRLWWVFAVRNPNTIKDPVFDFVPGKRIFLPNKDLLFTSIGN